MLLIILLEDLFTGNLFTIILDDSMQIEFQNEPNL
jgi:hypothetical protein